MLQTLRSHMQLLPTRKKAESRISRHGMLSPPPSKDLDYRDSNAVLVTKVNKEGQEMPVAIAFVNKRARVSIYHLSELSEDV
jgi:hypothetical protein